LNAAEKIFREATVKFPDEGVLFNNLAQVLMDQGRKREAREAAMRAIELGGPLKSYFENTLEDIRNR
jgi:Flp pilus assembly protein TadD